jgi:hypothetical protein
MEVRLRIAAVCLPPSLRAYLCCVEGREILLWTVHLLCYKLRFVMFAWDGRCSSYRVHARAWACATLAVLWERLLLVMLATICKTSPRTWWRLGGCGLEMHHPVSNNATASVRLEVYAAKELCLCVRSGCNAYSRATIFVGQCRCNEIPSHFITCAV